MGAILLEQNDEWAVQRARYMTRETMNEMMIEPPALNLPAVAARTPKPRPASSPPSDQRATPGLETRSSDPVGRPPTFKQGGCPGVVRKPNDRALAPQTGIPVVEDSDQPANPKPDDRYVTVRDDAPIPNVTAPNRQDFLHPHMDDPRRSTETFPNP